MGCDIHCVIERKREQDAGWTGIICSDLGRPRPLFARRDYSFFAAIASVRGSSKHNNYPRNLPEDVSVLAWQEYMSAPTDHHSASHMPLDTFCELWLACNPNYKEVRQEFFLHDLTGLWTDDDKPTEYRVVFWFDN